MVNKKKLNVTLVSIIPNLINGEGHIIPYHLAVNKCSKILNWQHKVAYSSNNNNQNLSNLPTQWNGCLKGANLESPASFFGQFTKLIDVFFFAQSIVSFWKKEVEKESSQKIIFLERFIHLQLFALWLATLLISKKDLSVWILYRRDTHTNKTRFIYKLLNKLIKNRVSPNNFHLLTDSDLLSKSLSEYFEEKVIVMPIPHTELIKDNKEINNKNDYIICWWAGPPREEKGWEIVKNLAKHQTVEAQKFCLVAAKSSLLKPTKGGVNINLIEDNINRLDYVSWLNKCDFVLLPYDAQAYKERTSGIFTESIIAGKKILVTPNSWMAQELSKYKLDSLIINWDNINEIFSCLEKILKDETIEEKIKVMQQEYTNFHTIENYALTMKKLL